MTYEDLRNDCVEIRRRQIRRDVYAELKIGGPRDIDGLRHILGLGLPATLRAVRELCLSGHVQLDSFEEPTEARAA